MFTNMKLATKLFSAFLTMLLLIVGLGVYALFQISKVNDSTVDLATLNRKIPVRKRRRFINSFQHNI